MASQIHDYRDRNTRMERTKRILQTVVAWVRYAEVFKYSRIRRVFHGVREKIPTP